MIDTTNIAVDCFVIKKKKKKKKRRKEKSMDVQMSGQLGTEDLFFSVLNEDVTRRIQIQDYYNVIVLFQREEERQNICWMTQYFDIENGGN